MDRKEEALRLHREWKGKIEVVSRVSVRNREELSFAYTPGVAEPCLVIKDNPDASYMYTRRGNLVLVVTDGSAVLGLGDIGPLAGMPVMEGKCALFKAFADVDAFPLCVASQDVDEIVRTVALISGSFGGINIEDIAAPRCFDIERRLKAACAVPVFHDDQHGTAIVVAAALVNALKVAGKSLETVKIALSGAGAAASSVARLLLAMGAANVTLSDRDGVVRAERAGLDPFTRELAGMTNPEGIRGGLADAMRGADVFVGLSAPGIVTADMIRSMAPGPIVFPMANPVPEIDPVLAERAGAAVVGTGRSDFKNQINNVLAFPGVFRGALDVRASDINEAMKAAAAGAIAGLVPPEKLSRDFIVPDAFDPAVGKAVAAAVAAAARASGVARA